MQLNQLGPTSFANKTRKRVGRGIGSGKGKTSGAGVKGQKSRTGVAIKGFEGGQQPIHRRLPKRGFKNIFRVPFQAVNLSYIQDAIDRGTIDAKQPITAEVLSNAGLIRRDYAPVKLLNKGGIKVAVTLEVDAASASAQQAIEKVGGKVVLPAQAA